MSPMLTRLLKALLPLLVLGVALAAAFVMWANRPPVETLTPVVTPPAVRVQTVAFESVDLTVSSQGTVQPRTASQLVPEIAGTVLDVSPAFAVGGFFEEGDVLLEIDPYDYQQALIAARSQLAQAQLRLAQEEAEAEVARREWEEIGQGDANPLTLRLPQVEDARAAVASAEAAIDRARRDLERADVRAPYAGRVQTKDVDVGQFVNRGTAVGRIYAVDSAEVRLPLPDEELAYVDVPMSYRGARQQAGPAVTLSADFAGRRYSWQGRIVRTEGEIDPVSRMVHVVAEVDDPYAPGPDPDRPPLAVGMFVEAEITGRRVDDVVVLPWAALNGRDRVLIVDDDGRLRYRQVDILRSTSEHVLVQGGLAAGERVSISALDAVIEGMAVQVAGAEPAAMARAGGASPAPGGGAEATAGTPAAATAAGTPGTAADPPAAMTAAGTPGTATSADTGRTTAISADAGRTTAPPADAGGAERPTPPTAPGAGPAAEAPAERPPAPAREPAAVPAAGTAASMPDPIREARREMARAGRPATGGARAPAPRRDDFELDPTLTREEQIAAIRERIAALRNGGAPTPAPVRRAGARPASPPGGAEERMAGAEPERPRFGGGRAPGNAAPGGGTAPGTPAGAARAADPGRRDARMAPTDAPAPAGAGVAPPMRRPGGPGGRGRVGGAPMPTPAGAARADAPTPAARPARADAPLAPGTPRPVVALLPFRNVSRDPADDVIGEEMQAVLRVALRRAAGMEVVLLGPGDESNAIQRAVASQATWLAGGGYQRVGEQLRVTGRVVDVATGDLLGSVRVDGTVSGRDALTSRLIAALRSELAGHMPAATAPRMAAAAPGPRAATASGPRTAAAPAARTAAAPDPVPAPPAGRAIQIAVSPFANISRNPADDAISDTIASEITGRMAGFPGVALVPLDTGAADGPASLSVASARGADWLVTGGYQHVAGQLRLTARLLQVSDGAFVESVKVDGTLDGLSGMLAEAISTLGAAVAANAAGS